MSVDTRVQEAPAALGKLLLDTARTAVSLYVIFRIAYLPFSYQLRTARWQGRQYLIKIG